MLLKKFILFLLLAEVSLNQDCGMDVKEFWPEVSNDLTKVKWSHATNSVEKLAQSLLDDTMMIEADVSLGSNGEVIMAHPPVQTSDLTLEQFLNTVVQSQASGRRKGIKLDFKYIEVVKPSLQLVRSMCGRITGPLWINADILGMKGSSSKPVDPDSFLQLTKQYIPSATLSLGYTTTCDGSYEDSDFDQMLQLIQQHEISAPVTLPLRACLLARSGQQTLRFLDKAGEDCTVTVWSGAEDTVDVEGLVNVIKDVGEHRLYLDVPEELRVQVEDQLASSSPLQLSSSTLPTVLLTAALTRQNI